MEVEIKLAPLRALHNLSDPDKNTILLIAKVMSTLHSPRIDSINWGVTKIQGDFDISVDYPLKTFFQSDHFKIIKNINRVLIKNVWVQNNDSNTITLYCKLGSIGSNQSYRITEITLEVKYESDKKRKLDPETPSVRFVKKRKL